MISKQPRNEASFIIRIWWEDDSTDSQVWRGQVVHARTRRSAHFKDLEGLLTFVERWVGNLFSWQGSGSHGVDLDRQD